MVGNKQAANQYCSMAGLAYAAWGWHKATVQGSGGGGMCAVGRERSRKQSKGKGKEAVQCRVVVAGRRQQVQVAWAAEQGKARKVWKGTSPTQNETQTNHNAHPPPKAFSF